MCLCLHWFLFDLVHGGKRGIALNYIEHYTGWMGMMRPPLFEGYLVKMQPGATAGRRQSGANLLGAQRGREKKNLKRKHKFLESRAPLI